MTKHLAQRLIGLRRVTLAPKATTKLTFDHAKGAFNIRALMIVRQELFVLELIMIIMIHLLKHAAGRSGGIALKCKVGRRTYLCNGAVTVRA